MIIQQKLESFECLPGRPINSITTKSSVASGNSQVAVVTGVKSADVLGVTRVSVRIPMDPWIIPAMRIGCCRFLNRHLFDCTSCCRLREKPRCWSYENARAESWTNIAPPTCRVLSVNILCDRTHEAHRQQYQNVADRKNTICHDSSPMYRLRSNHYSFRRLQGNYVILI